MIPKLPLFAALNALLLSACAGAPSSQSIEPLPAWKPTAYAAPAEPSNGSLYRSDGGLSLFSNRSARAPGDLLTIVLVERTNATSRASTSTSKDSSASLEAPSLFGGPLTANGRDLLSVDATAGRAFKGTGDSAQSNRLDGNLTVTVVDRMPNGNLVVQGEKRIRLNQGDETIQVQGVVRPADITPDNSVPSSRLADARITYGGRGPVARSNVMGWLTRFFNSPAMPL